MTQDGAKQLRLSVRTADCTDKVVIEKGQCFCDLPLELNELDEIGPERSN